MSDFKVVFTLKQHTPLIHFQSDQSGATLRATELKPKLDKFLLKRVPSLNYRENANGHKSLEYKVFISVQNSKKVKIQNRTYFGNMGKKPHDSEFRYAVESNGIKLKIHSFDTILIKVIKEWFPSFLALTNFGTRQSKGFGSFYLDKEDENYVNPIKALDKLEVAYIYANYNTSVSNVFSYVEVIYPLMKTGINFPDYRKKEISLRNGRTKRIPDPSQGRGRKESYYKSFLFKYMLQKSPAIGNEKRFIKENFFMPTLRIASDGYQKKYVRAMLGVSDGIEFRGDRYAKNKDHQRHGKIEYSNNDVKRFKSPLTFKIIGSQMIVIPHEIPEKIYGLKFSFKQRGEMKTFSKPIETPKSFDLVDFLYAFADYVNETLEVDKPHNSHNMFDEKIVQAQKAKFVKKENFSKVLS